jgi:type IX secretion system PorP/SprF family membrane protein
MKRRIIQIARLTASLFICISAAQAQDLHFTQDLENPLLVNPAMLGHNENFEVMGNYRDQWGMISQGFTTESFTVLMPLYLKPDNWKSDAGKSKLDFGVNVISDKAGAYTTLNAGLSVGYTLRITSSQFLSAALMGNYVQGAYDLTGQTFDEQYMWGSFNASNPTGESTLNQKNSYMDAGFGFMWHYMPTNGKVLAYSGFSVYHVNQPDISYIQNGTAILPTRFSYQLGLKFIGENKLDFSPILIFSRQGTINQLISGLLAAYHVGESSQIVLGAWYIGDEAIGAQAGFDHKNFTVMYSYDFGISDYNLAVSGLTTNEITLAFKINMAAKKGFSTPSF